LLLALHLSALLAKAYRNFNRFRRWPLADSDFAHQEKLLLHHKDFLEHRDNGDTIFGANRGRGASYNLIQFDSENVRFLPLQNRANELLDCFGVSDDADLAGCHRPFFDTARSSSSGTVGAPLRSALEITRLGRVWGLPPCGPGFGAGLGQMDMRVDVIDPRQWDVMMLAVGGSGSGELDFVLPV
jgi:hypothetical protein